jgi:hypothetical protein
MYDHTNETNNVELYSDCMGSDNTMRIRKLLLADRSEEITDEMLLGTCLEIMETEFRSLWKVHFLVMMDSLNLLIFRYRDLLTDINEFDLDAEEHQHLAACIYDCVDEGEVRYSAFRDYAAIAYSRVSLAGVRSGFVPKNLGDEDI